MRKRGKSSGIDTLSSVGCRPEVPTLSPGSAFHPASFLDGPGPGEGSQGPNTAKKPPATTLPCPDGGVWGSPAEGTRVLVVTHLFGTVFEASALIREAKERPGGPPAETRGGPPAGQLSAREVRPQSPSLAGDVSPPSPRRLCEASGRSGKEGNSGMHPQGALRTHTYRG